MRWHCPPDTGFEIPTLEVSGRESYLSATEAPHNTEFYEWIGKKHFSFFQTTETGKRTSNSSVKRSGANHYPRAPWLVVTGTVTVYSGVMKSQKAVSAYFFLTHSRLRGLVKWKNSKIREKLGLVIHRPPWPPTPLYNCLSFLTFGNMKTTQKNTKKNNNKIPTKNKNPCWDLTHPPTSEFFSDFLIFFNLTKPKSPNPAQGIYNNHQIPCNKLFTLFICV